MAKPSWVTSNSVPAFKPVRSRISTGITTPIVQSIVNTDGCVTSSQVLKGLPMGLDHSSLDTLRWWVYEPATLRGHSVDVYLNNTVNFTLE